MQTSVTPEEVARIESSSPFVKTGKFCSNIDKLEQDSTMRSLTQPYKQLRLSDLEYIKH